MKRLVLAFFCIIFVTAALSACAQVAPAAYRRGLSISAGGFASAFQPDYAGNGIAQTGPDRLYGPGAFVDVKFSRWVQIEAEGRWLHYNEYFGIDQNTYLIGPRIPIRNFHGFTPYGKFLFGMGSGSFLTGRTSVFAYGGGIDYRLKRKLTLRAVDFEYQQWQVNPTIIPYGISAGISYRVF